MNKTAFALIGYGSFLILIGLTGYLSNPEKAKTALLSGGTFGLINIALGTLALRGWRRSLPVALVVAAFLAAVFTWRTTVTWRAYLDGNSNKLVAAVLISSMLAATIWIGVVLIWARRRGPAGTTGD